MTVTSAENPGGWADAWPDAPFVVVAAVAERQAFRMPAPAPVTAVAPEAGRVRKAQTGFGNNMMAPYRNVIRLHLLIFFFAFASFAELESFPVYAVVYAVYFFPWRMLGKGTA